jgi:hypothetical protein
MHQNVSLNGVIENTYIKPITAANDISFQPFMYIAEVLWRLFTMMSILIWTNYIAVYNFSLAISFYQRKY